ncbi:MAG TPA: FIST N-terminal domain-containing protein [Elusimicrobiota bacterium]|nr:FIST N-terminal domain-containing protein [Elusimicrobiota bacterium]
MSAPAGKRFADGFSTDTDWRKAAAEAARAARAKLGSSPCDLALVFVSQVWDDFDPGELPLILARELAPLRSLGCNASGVIAGRREVEMARGVAVLAMRLPGARLHSFSLTGRELSRLEDGRALVAMLDLYPTDKPKFLAFGDPMTCDPDHLTSLLNQGYPGAPLVGGLSSGPQLKRPSWLLLNGEILENGVAAMALTGDVEFDVVVSQGCRPIGEPLIVTKAEGNVLQELGGRPPLDVLRETLSRCPPEDQRLARHSLFAGLVMEEGHSGYKRGDFVIRNLMGFDQDSGSLVLGANLRRGQTLQFQLRDAQTSDTDFQRMLGVMPEGGAAPRGALLVSCCGRGQGLYGEPDHDAALVQSMRGPLPLAGFFANGEFGPVDGRNYVHGYTSSLVVIR